MSEAQWGTPDPQYYQTSTLPEWTRQHRQETEEAFPSYQESASWSAQSQENRPRGYSNSPQVLHHGHTVLPTYPQATFLSSEPYSQSQPPYSHLQHTSYASSHGSHPAQLFDVGSISHRRGASTPSLDFGSVTPAASSYLFQQPTSGELSASASQFPTTQAWSRLSGQHMQPLPRLESRQQMQPDNVHGPAFLRGQLPQSMPLHAFVEQPPKQVFDDGQHRQAAIHALSVALESPGQPINDRIAQTSSSWQANTYMQPINNDGPTSFGTYALKEHRSSEPASSTSVSFPLPDTQYEDHTHIEPAYPLPHMQLPPSNGYLRPWNESQQDARLPYLVPTGMPLHRFEAGALQAHPDPSVSATPGANAMLYLSTSTNVAVPYLPVPNLTQHTAFPPLVNDQSYINSSTTSPYSEVPLDGQYTQVPYTSSAGQPSPSIGQVAQYPRNEYFADYQDTLDEQGYSSVPLPPSLPPISAGSVSGQLAASSSKRTKSKVGKVKRQTRQYEGICSNCQNHFATVTLRGVDADFSQPYLLQYYCVACAPGILAISLGKGMTLSKADEKQKGKFNRKRIRSTDPSAPALCDVCQRAAAYGGPVPIDMERELTFHTEVVCDQCTSRYMRCSDCGGGGGARCGVGKWRCKELFADGRKTCSLNHSRQSSVSSMQYSVMRIRDIPPEEKPELLNKCRRVFELSLLSTLAVPEVLERGTAMADTFADVKDKVERGWVDGSQAFEDDKEETEGIRRYLGVRWSAPKPRKSTSASNRKATDDQLSSPDVPQDPVVSEQMIIPGMNVAGFVTAEWAMTQGTLYISISVPYSTGEQYEGAAHLINMLETRARREREEVLASRGAETAAIPPVEHSFTMIFFTSDSKYMAFLESKRQLLPLERYLQMYPQTDPKIFPPYRKIFISPERAVGLTCIVRHLNTQAGDASKQKIMKSSAKQQKSKQVG